MTYAWNKAGGVVVSAADNIKVAIDQLARVRKEKADLEKLEDKLKRSPEAQQAAR